MYQTNSINGPFLTYDATAGQTALNAGSIFRMLDLEPSIEFKRPYDAVFYKFLNAVNHGKLATQEKVEWGEQEMLANYVTVSAATGASDTSITVTNAYNCVPGDKLYCWETDEMIRLDAIDSATVISCAAVTGYGRGFAGTTSAAMKAGYRLYKMGNALTERGRTPQAINKMPVPFYNYNSYYVSAVEAVKAQENSIMLGNFGKISERMMNVVFEQRRNVETDLWKGKRTLVVVTAAAAHDSGGGPLYQMNGFDQQVVTHAHDLTKVTQMTYELWCEILGPLFTIDSRDRQMYCGANVTASLMNTARGNTVFDQYRSVIEGVNVTAIKVDGGTVHVIPDHDGLPPGSARVVLSDNVEYREREGMSEQWVMNTQLPTQVRDITHTFMCGGTLVVHNEETMAKIDGLGGYSSRGLLGDITG